jgi:dTDP-4-dehydrorhamnose reductase
VTGSEGRLGRGLAAALASIGDVIALDRVRLDITDRFRVRQALESHRPDWVVNAAGFTDVDAAESSAAQAYAINAAAAGGLANDTLLVGAKLIHYSSDYVFDGTASRAYVESDSPNPINKYGKSKLLGERLIQDSGCPHIMFRVSSIYSDIKGNFIKTIAHLAHRREVIHVVDNQYVSPTSVGTVAKFTAFAIQKESADTALNGIYHLCTQGSISRYELARLVVQYLTDAGLPLVLRPECVRPAKIQPANYLAARPLNCLLDCSLLSGLLRVQMPRWEDDVMHYLERLSKTTWTDAATSST